MPNQPHGPSALNHLVGDVTSNFDTRTLLQDTVRTLSNLDFEHRHEMHKLEISSTDPILKKQIADSLRQRHRERREPYVRLIAELQKHTSLASPRPLKVAG